MRYTEDDILQIIKANHRQRIQVEKGIPNEENITYDLSIRDWIDDMELLEWKELSVYYVKIFQIAEKAVEFREAMKPIKKKTIQDLCQFLSKTATKPTIPPITLFGRPCQKAAIFRFLKNRLVENNQKAQAIAPSSKLREYMEDFSFAIIEEVNKITPQALPSLQYEPNELENQLWKSIVGGFTLLLIASLLGDNWFVGGIGIGVLISGVWMGSISNKIPPKSFEFEGLDTFRDLIEKIELDIYSNYK